jgi:addiction module HigA family antidote
MISGASASDGKMVTRTKLRSSIIIRSSIVPKKLAPVHPGEVLAEDFIAPSGLTANQLALSLRIPANRITAIIAGKRGITADTALRLARYFGTSAEVWMGLQADYDLQTERDRNGAEIERAVLLPI